MLPCRSHSLPSPKAVGSPSQPGGQHSSPGGLFTAFLEAPNSTAEGSLNCQKKCDHLPPHASEKTSKPEAPGGDSSCCICSYEWRQGWPPRLTFTLDSPSVTCRLLTKKAQNLKIPRNSCQRSTVSMIPGWLILVANRLA